jgi:hypothetical protein
MLIFYESLLSEIIACWSFGEAQARSAASDSCRESRAVVWQQKDVCCRTQPLDKLNAWQRGRCCLMLVVKAAGVTMMLVAKR